LPGNLSTWLNATCSGSCEWDKWGNNENRIHAYLSSFTQKLFKRFLKFKRASILVIVLKVEWIMTFKNSSKKTSWTKGIFASFLFVNTEVNSTREQMTLRSLCIFSCQRPTEPSCSVPVKLIQDSSTLNLGPSCFKQG